MGTTNIKLGLERKYVRVKGERMSKEADLIHIRNLIASLPELEALVARLQELEDSIAVVLGHIAPDWEGDKLAAVRAHTYHLPIKIGECSRKGMEILREATEPMTIREIAVEVLRRCDVIDPDRDTLERTCNALHGALRHRRGKVVESDKQYPQRWRVMQTS